MLISKEIGPGVLYQRYRLPDYPLNFNILKVDLNNPYNSVETTLAIDNLAVGDEEVVNHYWYTCADGSHPNIRQAVAGNEIVLLNGDPSNSVPGISAQWMPVARLRCL